MPLPVSTLISADMRSSASSYPSVWSSLSSCLEEGVSNLTPDDFPVEALAEALFAPNWKAGVAGAGVSSSSLRIRASGLGAKAARGSLAFFGVANFRLGVFRGVVRRLRWTGWSRR